MRPRPARTCLGCRRVKSRHALVRLVRGQDGVVVADPSGSAPGRGAYVCREDACVERALQRARLSHAFRRPCEVGGDLMTEVRAAIRSGAAASGEIAR